MAYERINWQNEPSEATALNDVNLNKMDSAIYELDGKATTTETAITALQDGKVDKVNGKGLSQVDNVTVTQHVAYGTVVSTIKTYKQDGTEVTSQVCNGIVVDSALSNSSTNPVQNKVVKSAIDEKSTVAISDTLETGTTLANITIDGTTTAIKGSDIEVDEELSPTSTNPVENKAIYDALNNLLPSKTVSGNPIAISDASGFDAKALKVTMNPIQDLHGYSNPWAGGAGKNKLDISSVNTSASANWGVTISNDELTVEHKNTYSTGVPRTADIELTEGTYCVSYNATSVIVLDLYVNGSWLKSINNGDTFTLSASSTVYITFPNTQATTITYKKVQLESGSTPTGYAPYSNICPISGRTEASVTRTGRNLFDKTAKDTSKGYVANRYLTSLGTEYTPGSGNWYISEYMECEANTNYTLTGLSTTDSNAPCFGFYTSNKTFISATQYRNEGTKTFTTPSNTTYIRISVGPNVTQEDNITLLETGKIQTHTHQYSETIYGGVDDFGNGGAESTYGIVDLGTLNWVTINASTGLFYSADVTDEKREMQGITVLSSALTPIANRDASSTITTDYSVCMYNGVTKTTHRVYVKVPTISTPSDLQTYLSGTTLCYPLATPTTISTSAEEITLLKGNNVLSTNADDMELKYSVSLDSLLPAETRTLAKSPIVEEPKEETDETEEQR